MAELDAEYLKNTVGSVLADALTNAVIQQPADPIEYIGNFLLNFVKTEKKKAEVFIKLFNLSGLIFRNKFLLNP
jgi:hypothetical protein